MRSANPSTSSASYCSPSSRRVSRTASICVRSRSSSEPAKAGLEVLAGVGDRVDRATRLGALLAGDQRADEHDPLALLAGDPRPVVGVGGVGQVFVLLELVDAGLEEVTDPDALLVLVEEVLDRHLLGPVD